MPRTDFSPVVYDPERRHEFVYLFEVINSNPNGDPDALNAPRTISETGRGLVTDTSIKRKVRDFVLMTESDIPIFIESDRALNDKKADIAKSAVPPITSDGKKVVPRLAERMWETYYDIRMFGAVLSTGDSTDRLNAGKVTGPIQLGFATSIDPISVKHNAGSRKARTTPQRLETGDTEFGVSTPIVPYGLYRAHGFFNPFLAAKTGVSTDDLDLFWIALINAFELSRSRSRSEINVRGLSVFSHDNKLGRAPAHKLLARVNPRLKPSVETPASYGDYDIIVDDENLPNGVELNHLVDPRQ